MNNASPAGGREPDRPTDAESFFPSEGSFNTVVPLSEIGHTPIARADAADVGKPVEAAWARAAHRAGVSGQKEEETLVPTRSGRARASGIWSSWGVMAVALVLSVAAGLTSGAYLVWSSQRAAESRRASSPTGEETAAADKAAAEASPTEPSPASAATPTPEASGNEARAQTEKLNEAAKEEKTREVAKAERPNEVSHATKQTPPAALTRVERPARAADEVRETTPAPKVTRSQSVPAMRPRVTTAAKQSPAPPSSARDFPVSSPPPSARSRKVIQWP